MKHLLCIFIPGIKGTCLYSAKTGECLWPASRVLETWRCLFDKCDTQFRQLLLPDNLTDTQEDPSIRVGSVLKNVKIAGVYNRDVYGKTIDKIKNDIQSEWESNGHLAVFNYDWRRSINHCGAALNKYIVNTREQIILKYSISLDNIVTVIIAHSYGGLVTYNTIHKFQNVGIDRLLTIGTPHFGSRASLRYLVGDGQWSLCSDQTLFNLSITLDCLYDTLPVDAMSDVRLIGRSKLHAAMNRRRDLPGSDQLYACKNCPMIIHLNVENVSRRIEGKICRGDGVVESQSCILEKNVSDKKKLIAELKRATQHIKLLYHPYTFTLFKKILTRPT